MPDSTAVRQRRYMRRLKERARRADAAERENAILQRENASLRARLRRSKPGPKRRKTR